MKKLFLLLYTIPLFANAQVQDTSFPQLNAGGVVNAVAGDTVRNILYIAGNFTSVSGSARKNIAAINLATNTVIPFFNPVTSMPGEILAMVHYENYLYIAGSFTSINGNVTNHYLSRIQLSAGGITGAVDQTWNLNPDSKINDLCLDSNRIYIAGGGIVIDDLYSGEVRIRLACINATNGSLLPFDPSIRIANSSFSWGSFEPVKLHCTHNRLYVCGRNFGGAFNDGIIALNKSNGDVISSFNPNFTFQQVVDCETYNGKIYVLNSKIWPGGFSLMEIDEQTSTINTGAFVITGNGNPEAIVRYKNYLYVAGGFESVQGNLQNYLCSINLNNQQLISWNPLATNSFSNSRGLLRIKNYLYLSDVNLSSIELISRLGIARFCLEPFNVGPININDVTWCPGQTGIMGYIDQVWYADNYIWNYSGQGLQIISNGNSANFIPESNITAGVLSCKPINSCGLSVDSSALSILINVLPIVDAGADTTITCIRDSVVLIGSSTNLNVSFHWINPEQDLFSGASLTTNSSGSHFLTIYDSLTTCINSDSVFVFADTAKPELTLPFGTFELTCSDTNLILFGNSATPFTDLYWNKNGGGIYPNPFSCTEIGQYYLTGANIINGCRDSCLLSVSQNIMAPTIYLISHDESQLIIDTLNCLKDSILIIGSSLNSTVNYLWAQNNLIIGTNDSVILTADGTYIFECIDSLNGCSAIIPFVILENLNQPIYTLNSDSLFINCSIDSVQLLINQVSGNEYYWFFHNNLIPNATFLSDTGTVYLNVVSTSSGCSVSDSLFIVFKPEIIFQNSNDTIICKYSELMFVPKVVGNFTSITYNFNYIPSNSDTLIAMIDTNSIFLIEAISGNCVGMDTLYVNIPSEIKDSIVGYGSCNNSGYNGAFFIFTEGGFAPFDFSIDTGITFQNSAYFDSLNFGSYQILIKDSLSCIYAIDYDFINTGNIPMPDFLISSLGMMTDTLVAVNKNVPDQDSLIWSYDNRFTLLAENSENIWLHALDTGHLFIRMEAWFNGCYTEKLKSVYIDLLDTTAANWNHNSAILNKIIYPNPNNGQFTFECELEGKQSIRIVIAQMNGFIIDESEFDNVNYINKHYSLGNIEPGKYILVIQGEFVRGHEYFIVHD